MAKKRSNPVVPPKKIPVIPIGIAVVSIGLISIGAYRYTHRPPTIKSLISLGDEYARQGKAALAMQEYAAAATLDKTDAEPYLAMSRLEEAAGNLGAAADRLGTVLHYHPKHPHIQCHRAELYGLANRYEMAYRVAQDAVKVEPDCPAAHNDMGMLLELAGDEVGAARELGRAHILSPGDEALTLDYARVLAKSGKPDDALNIVEGVIPVTKLFKVPAYYIEGLILAEYGRGGRKDYLNAQISLGKALAINNQHTASLAESGRIFLKQHLYTAAQDQLEKAHKYGPDTIEILSDLVELYKAQSSKKLADAESITDQMTAMLLPLKSYRRKWLQNPDDLANKASLATAEMTAGNVFDAYDLVKEILAVEPENESAIKLYNEMKSSTAPREADSSSSRQGSSLH